MAVITAGKRWSSALRVLMLVMGVLVCLAGSACASQAPPPERTWDGLELVQREGFDLVYIRPGANLAPYRRVILRHAEVSFDKNWKPNKDSSTPGKELDPNRIAREVQDAFYEITVSELQKGSYSIVSAPDSDVLRVVPTIIDLYVSSPPTAEPGLDTSMRMDLGHMTLVVELRDSLTNTALARVVDRVEDSSGTGLEVGGGLTNSEAAERIITKWAVALRSALDRAHAQPPAEAARPVSER